MLEKKEAINKQIELAQQEMSDRERRLADAEETVSKLLQKREKYYLLRNAIDAVQTLQDKGGASLFWKQVVTEDDGQEHLQRLIDDIDTYNEQLNEAEESRQAALEDVGVHQEQIDLLSSDLFDLEQEEESRRQEWLIERAPDELPKRNQVMPWMRGFEDDRRFRKALTSALCVSLILSIIIPLINIPLRENDEPIEVPERFVQLIREQQREPLPPPQEQQIVQEESEPEPQPEEVVEETPPEVVEQRVAEEQAPVEQPSTRERVASQGILAFRESFSNLAESRPSARLGADASINNAGDTATGRPERDMVTSQAQGSSGGINLSSLSRDVGDGGNGGSMAGVVTTQVASSIGGSGTDRPLASSGIAGRTDEEIQIVFDRYKAALYRMYNRELRRDPSLRGQLVLQLTIEPDGSVSLCLLQDSSLGAPELAQQIVERVRSFNFGAKEVPAVTILYPIDFLPTA